MTRARALFCARWVFVLLTIGCAWWGFRGRWSDIAEAGAGTGPWRLVGAVVLVALGLVLTGHLWRLLLRWVGSDVAARDAAAVFFVGQLGKYVPGSVWSLAVQAQLGRRHGVPARSSITASALFLLVHTATGLVLGGVLVVAGPAHHGLDGVWPWAAVGLGALVLAPPLLRRLADRLVGHRIRSAIGLSEVARASALMAIVWACYGSSLLLLVPEAGSGAPGLAGAVAVFALAHAVGVLVVLAPAGVGAREAVLVALLAPSIGVPGAAAVALLSRVAHALADFLVAGAAQGWARAGRSVEATEPARVRGR